MSSSIPASFSPDDSVVATGPRGQRAHQQQFTHLERLAEGFHEVTDHVWCQVGNGLSNQTFIEGPEGLIVIDTGESIEEMSASLSAVREYCSAPVAAVIYTHYHYCSGTQALLNGQNDDMPIWGHFGIEKNLQTMATEISPTGGRGLVHQFSMLLPEEGPDAAASVGLGLYYRRAEHAPFTSGFIAPNHLVSETTEATIAGLRVQMVPAPSDADDNITIFFPDLGVCVNNLVWPALFNVFAIRGEPYRDPRVLISGLDQILSMNPEYLVGAHGPPIVGKDTISAGVIDARDALQYLWDQTVRGVNRGLTQGELIEFVQLPDFFERSYLTQQNYGLVEHHVRQIHNGLVGWFDGEESSLFPLPTVERCQRLIEGFGGREKVFKQAKNALEENDLRWALELATWLIRSEENSVGRADGGSTEERGLLAGVLREISQRTTSANVRGWCLTRVLELEEKIDLSRFRIHRFGRNQVLAGSAETFIHSLKVLVDPLKTEGLNMHLRWVITDGITTGLWVRNCVAIPTDGSDADAEIVLSQEVLADLLSGRVSLSTSIDDGNIEINGDAEQTRQLLNCFDLLSFRD